MLKRIQNWAVLVLWFCATGAQWDLVQVVAWGKMFVGYSETMDFSKAASKTFSGEMCEMCRVVQHAKEQQKELPAADASKAKVVLICQMATCRVFDCSLERPMPPMAVSEMPLRVTKPPTPPPRAA